MVHKLIIIGSGPAGLTAAIYAARANLAPVLFEGINPGGPLTLEDYKIENFPGFTDGILGRELIDATKKQAERFGAKFLSREVTEVDFGSRPFKIFSDEEKYEAKSVIVATGTEEFEIDQLGLDTKARNILVEAGLTHIEDLSTDKLDAVKGIGPKTLDKIKVQLASYKS